jgi:hypothetical protein
MITFSPKQMTLTLSPKQMTLTLFFHITLFHIKYFHTIRCQAHLCGPNLNLQKGMCKTWKHKKEKE